MVQPTELLLSSVTSTPSWGQLRIGNGEKGQKTSRLPAVSFFPSPLEVGYWSMRSRGETAEPIPSSFLSLVCIILCISGNLVSSRGFLCQWKEVEKMGNTWERERFFSFKKIYRALHRWRCNTTPAFRGWNTLIFKKKSFCSKEVRTLVKGWMVPSICTKKFV